MNETHLRSVRDEDLDEATDSTRDMVTTESGIPNFEGEAVDYARIKLAAVSRVDVGDAWSRIEDTVRMYVEGRVTAVHHAVDEVSGKLVRVHTIKVVDARQLPWDFDAGQFE